MNTVLLSGASRNWIVRYKLYHLPFWFLYNYILWVLAMGNIIKASQVMSYLPFTIKFSFYALFQAAAVYFNLYFLMPRFFDRGRYTLYSVYLLLTLIAAASLIIPGYYLGSAIAHMTPEQAFGAEASCFYHFYSTTLPTTLAATTFAMSFKLAKKWIATEKRQQILEKEKLETELNFLKYQFNPHFLFNTINSIFFLIHKNPDRASASLAKFSDLLRHQLYECNDKQILLSKEIANLENSIELEQLRLNDNVTVDLDICQQSSQLLGIAPFILMTFVENAFKHVSRHTDQPNWIRIRLFVQQAQLDLEVSNSTMNEGVSDLIHYGGIGLKNVQRRLDLLYPDNYELTIQRYADRFEGRLRMQLYKL